MTRRLLCAMLLTLTSCVPSWWPDGTDEPTTTTSSTDTADATDTDGTTETEIPWEPGERPPARPSNERRGSCDGVLDYADELLPENVTVVRETNIGDGFVEVELTLRLVNRGAARFRSASATLRQPADLGIVEHTGRDAFIPGRIARRQCQCRAAQQRGRKDPFRHPIFSRSPSILDVNVKSAREGARVQGRIWEGSKGASNSIVIPAKAGVSP